MTTKFSVDIELTNRCNAKCHFCPRDRTPHQGLMTRETFEQSLERALEYRQVSLDRLGIDIGVSLCGLGEPLLNPRAAESAAAVRAAGLDVTMSTNGSLLTEQRGAELLDAGLQAAFINVGTEGDDYEEVYQLPFERTLENVVRFNEMAAGRCEVTVVLVDYKADPAHLARMRQYWHDHGVQRTYATDIINRGGSLFVDHMQYETYSELTAAKKQLAAAAGTPICGAPFAYLFIGYDGQYYLCCSDWEKQAPMGSVFDCSFLDVTEAKLAYVASREPVCNTCNLDPVNRLTEELRAVSEGKAPESAATEMLERVSGDVAGTIRMVEGLGFKVPDPAPDRRRHIPVRSL